MSVVSLADRARERNGRETQRLIEADQLLRSLEFGIRQDERARIVANLRALGHERPQLANQLEVVAAMIETKGV